jgi:tripartite-type tricarboxylate transporter receptor subunit TctC
MMKRTQILVLAVALSLVCMMAAVFEASAADDGANYPSKPIQMVLAANPGGGTDNTLRMLLKYLPKEVGGDIAVVYIEGGGGTVGNRRVKEAKPDGYIMSYFNENIVNNQLAGLADFGMDIYDDILIVVIINTNAMTSNKFKNSAEMAAYGKANPGKLRFGIEVGTWSEQTACAWMLANDIEGTLIDVGAVNGQVASLAGDHADCIVTPMNTTVPFVKDGKFFYIASPSLERNAAFPDVPTLLELGVDISLPRYYYIGIPKGTPKYVGKKIEAALKRVNENPAYIADMERLNVTPVFWDLEKSAKFVAESIEIMKKNNQYTLEYEKKYGKIN